MYSLGFWFYVTTEKKGIEKWEMYLYIIDRHIHIGRGTLSRTRGAGSSVTIQACTTMHD